MQELQQFLSSLNYTIPNLTLDGNIHRFSHGGKKDAGWYVGFQNQEINGSGPYIVAVVSDWKSGEKHTYKPNKKMSREDTAVIKSQLLEAMKKAEEEKKKKQVESSEYSEKVFSTAVTGVQGTSEYIAKKKISSHAVINKEGTIFIPMYDVDGKLWGCQRIFPDGQKRFISGQRTSGCFFTLGELTDETKEIFICEGWATGCTIYEVTKNTTIVAFNAGNLKDVTLAIHSEYPLTKITICADNDRFSDINIGVDKASSAAMLCNGVVKCPSFKSNDSGTDFNDLYVDEGIVAVKDQLLEYVEDTYGFMALGYIEHDYYFYSNAQKDVVKITSFSPTQMFALAPKEYWDMKYIAKNGTNWNLAKNDLVVACRKRGTFDRQNCRGSGLWYDRNRVILNSGRSLKINGRPTSMRDLESDFIYIKTKYTIPEAHLKPLSVDECMSLVSVCQEFKWDNKNSGSLLAGWLAIARIAGALPIRPHIWLTGGAGSGKSFIMDSLIVNALGDPSGKAHFQGSTTEAGIRQAMKGSSIPIIFDEFETNNAANKQRVESVIELVRQCWRSTGAVTTKGSSSGDSESYSVNFSILVASIRVSLSDPADRGRFSILELLPHDNSDEQLKKIRNELSMITREYGERLFARMINLIPVIIASHEVLSTELTSKVNERRFGDQTGMLLAGYWALHSDEVIDVETARNLVSSFGSHKDEKLMPDEEEALNHLTTWKFSVTDLNGYKNDLTLIKIFDLKDDMIKRSYISSLESYGLYLYKDSHLFIPTQNAEIEKIYRNTRWVDWTKNILRVDKGKNIGDSGVLRHHFYRSKDKKMIRGIIIPLDKI